MTHTCWYDIPVVANIPNMVYLAPTTYEEYIAMLNWSIQQTAHPVSIRVPVGPVVHTTNAVDTDYSDLNKYKIEEEGSKVAIIGLGNQLATAKEAARILREKHGITPTVINPRYITGLDTDLLDSLKATHSLVITIEDGLIDGGFGEKIARHYAATADTKVIVRGAKKQFQDRYNPADLLQQYRMTAEQIAADAAENA